MSKIYRLGVIGLGSRLTDYLGDFYELWTDWKITTIADPNTEGMKKRIEKNPNFFSEDVSLYTTADEMLEKEDVDGILIGTRCSLHTEMAVKAMVKHVPIFLEKPVCTTFEDLQRLKEAGKKYDARVLVSFPLRFTEHIELTKEIIDSGEIGEVLQVDAFNDVPYGRVYYHNWYRDEKETGGLWLQKATHDFDCINYILGQKAVAISAMDARKFFGGNEPAGLKCKDCPKYIDCPESPYVINKIYRDPYGCPGQYCAFGEDVGNQECGTAIIRYETGLIATYTQNFFARMHSHRRGARYYGYKGTVQYDFYTHEVTVFSNVAARYNTYKIDEPGHHFGGDIRLSKMFRSMLMGEDTSSYLDIGLESARMCLLAEKSCRTDEFIKIDRETY